jgi:hypothetical protein
LVTTSEVIVLMRHAYFSATRSSQPVRRGLPVLVVQLGRERARADARRVRLRDADDLVDVLRADAGADARRAGDRVRRRHERIRPVVDVEHRRLGALEEDRALLVEHLPRELARVGDVLLDAMAVGQVLLGHRLQVEARVLLERPEAEPLRVHRGDDLLLEDLLVEQVLDADAQARGLVGVAGTDAAACGADLLLAELDLAGRVEQQVVRHDQVRVGADLQAAHVDPAGLEAVDLAGEHLRVDDDAVADDAALALVEDAAGDQVQGELLAVAHDRMAGVVAALEADDGVGSLGKEIDDLPLALVTPLGADHD